jgi:hypothetical protein
MRAKRLIQKISDFLNLANFTLSGKKRALKELLQKLKEKRIALLKELKEELPAEEEKRLREELELLSLHIAKAKKKIESL